MQGTYSVGQILPIEAELAEELGVSRATIRESLRALRGKGLLQTVSRRGSTVQSESSWNLMDAQILSWKYSGSPSNKNIDDLMQLRLIVEPAAARIAAQRCAPVHITALRDALHEMEIAVTNTTRFIDADLRFHAALIAGSENDLLVHLNGLMSDALAAHRRLHTRGASRHRETLQEHRDVLRAVSEGDGHEAQRALHGLIESAQNDVLYYTGRSNVLENIEPEIPPMDSK